MRTRIALLAALAAGIVISTAVACAAATIGPSPFAGAVHTQRATKDALIVPFFQRHTSILTPQYAREIELQTMWRRLSLPAPAKPAPAPAVPAATPPPPPPPPAPAPVPAPQPVLVSSSSADATSTTTPDWACIRDHESDDNYADNTGNGYSGAYQFMPSTWDEAVSGAGYGQYANGEAFEAPPAVQNAAALWLYNRDGWAPWSTRYVCGL